MIQFKKLIIHNFCSYGHSELDLQNKGFCLVSGENNFKKDNALSNGSGKSTWINAISACLTGETLNGLHNNFKNINIEENNCYVSLDFNVDSDSYSVTRIFNPKSDLKIIKNNVDISGKGIRESESILGNHLPEINKDLLGSSILIGQGFPNKLTALQPSKRKELLEGLTKTDFMIEDVKNRVTSRSAFLSKKLREIEDSILVKQTELNSAVTGLSSVERELVNYSSSKPDFTSEMNNLRSIIATLTEQKNVTESSLLPLDNEIAETSKQQLDKISQKAADTTSLNEAYNTKLNSLKDEDRKRFGNRISELTTQISKIKAIKDTCPTCKQKLINVEKPDVRPLEQELSRLQSERYEFGKQISAATDQYQAYQEKIYQDYASELTALDRQVSELKSKKSKLSLSLKNLERQISDQNINLVNLENRRLTWDSKLQSLLDQKAMLLTSKDSLESTIKTYLSEKDSLQNHLDVVKKMDTLIKRDFRGILLQNVINYLNATSKIYSQIVFGTDELDIFLDGNNLDVSYCGKLVEQLSGGERTRVDLIVQLSIRKMLQSYLNMTSNILVLDEVTDFLDKKSCNAIMKLIDEELSSTESVFIISHMADSLEIPVDSELHVVKDVNGISEIQ